MFNLKTPYTVLAMIIASSLTACGGGGENGDGGGNVAPPSISLTNDNIDLQEAGETSISFSLANSGSAAIVSATSNNELVSVDVTGTTLNIVTKEVDNDTKAQVTILVKFGGQEGTSTLNLNVINTSIISAYQKGDAIVSMLIDDYQDETQLFNYAVQNGYLSGTIAKSTSDNFSQRFYTSLSGISDGLAIAESLSLALEAYTESTITETQFRAELQAMIAKYNVSLSESNAIANELFDLVGAPFSTLELNGNVYEENTLQLSQVLNSTTGQYTGDQWQFNNNFAFMEDVLPSFNPGQLCLANEED